MCWEGGNWDCSSRDQTEVVESGTRSSWSQKFRGKVLFSVPADSEAPKMQPLEARVPLGMQSVRSKQYWNYQYYYLVFLSYIWSFNNRTFFNILLKIQFKILHRTAERKHSSLFFNLDRSSRLGNLCRQVWCLYSNLTITCRDSTIWHLRAQ